MRTPYSTFDIYLLEAPGAPMRVTGLREALSASPLRSQPGDSSRAWYRNVETSVFFEVLIAPALVAMLRRGEDGESEEYEERGESEHADGTPPEVQGPEDADPGEDTGPPLEMAPITLAVPCLTPSFFGREAAAFAAKLAMASGLRFDCSSPEVEGAGSPLAPLAHPDGLEGILASWDRSNRGAARGLEARAGLFVWSAYKSAAWHAYGSRRLALEAELAADEVIVPRLFAARHGGEVKTLCPWEPGTPVVLPRIDLVLLRRERERKGLFFSRRTTEEGLVSGETIWDLLSPFAELRDYAELRDAPARLLICREARRLPAPVTRALEALILEPVENATRTELLGVVDFEAGEAEA